MSLFQRAAAKTPAIVQRFLLHPSLPSLRSLASAWPGFAVGVLSTLAAVWYLHSPQPVPAVQPSAAPTPAAPSQSQPPTATAVLSPPEPQPLPPQAVPTPDPNPKRADWPFATRRACHLANAAVTSFGCLEHPVAQRFRIASIYAAARLNQLPLFSYRNTDATMLYGSTALCVKLNSPPSGTCYAIALTLADTTFTLYQPKPPSRGVDIDVSRIAIPTPDYPSQTMRQREPNFWDYLFKDR